MKHYELQIRASRYVYTFESMRICEIYEALVDASESFGFELDKDRVMSDLVDLSRGEISSRENYRYMIAIRDEEVRKGISERGELE